MRLIKWEYLPQELQNSEVKPYYNQLLKKKKSLLLKRLFDIFGSVILIIILLPVILIIGLVIKITSKGRIIYKQCRVTQYGRQFTIYKFRTMIEDADKIGSLVTHKKDTRITKVGTILRKYRLDELPQLVNIFLGDMTFVGARPEVLKYVEAYNNEMLATLLLPAGVTSETSIRFKDEDQLLDNVENIDEVYIREVLPQKMLFNLNYLKEFGLYKDIKIILTTIQEVFF